MIQTVGKDKFEQQCALTIRRKIRQKGEPGNGFINIAVAFCLIDGETPATVEKFRKELVNSYVTALDKTQNLMKIQRYQKHTPINIQFYDPSLDSQDSTVPNYFMNFNDEGYNLLTEYVK
jgi:hypothetical protein